MHCLSVCIPSIAVIQHPHAPVFGVRTKDFLNRQQGTVKLVRMWTTCIFPRRKTNATSIASVFTNFVNSKVCFFYQAQTNNPPNTMARTLDECVTTSIRMCIATAPMADGEETEENNLHRAVRIQQQKNHTYGECV